MDTTPIATTAAALGSLIDAIQQLATLLPPDRQGPVADALKRVRLARNDLYLRIDQGGGDPAGPDAA